MDSYLNDPYLLELSKRIIESNKQVDNESTNSLTYNEYLVIFIKHLKNITKDKTDYVFKQSIKNPQFNNILKELVELQYDIDKFEKGIINSKHTLNSLKPQYLIGNQTDNTIDQTISNFSDVFTKSLNVDLSNTKL